MTFGTVEQVGATRLLPDRFPALASHQTPFASLFVRCRCRRNHCSADWAATCSIRRWGPALVAVTALSNAELFRSYGRELVTDGSSSYQTRQPGGSPSPYLRRVPQQQMRLDESFFVQGNNADAIAHDRGPANLS